MIAMKREVAARIERVFRGANVKRPIWPVNLATSHCTNTVKFFAYQLKRSKEGVDRLCICVSVIGNTRVSVQSPLVVLKCKVRKGGDFFLWQVK